MEVALGAPADPLAVPTDLVVVTLVGEPLPLEGPAASLDSALGGQVARALADGELEGKSGRSTLFHAAGGSAAARALAVGVGSGSPDDWRSAGRAAATRAADAHARSLALLTPAGAGDGEVAAFLEGLGRAAYRFDRFKTSDDPGPALERVTVHSDAVAAGTLARAERLMAAVAAARDLGNTPSSSLTPATLAEYAAGLAADVPGLECTVLGPDELEELGAGALLGVARGSDEPPRMIVLRHRPGSVARPGEVLGLVGKAVTFDTGGISIKPSGGMEEMKLDMMGGGAVIEGTALVARLGLPVEILAVVPATENMPSGRAVKPGDVLTALNGRTIEVVNTDAEGRLILADGLAYAVREGATRLVDVATLTGAIVVALGEVYAGLFGSDPDWTERVRAAGESSGDIVWPMPLHEGYRPLIESKVADLANAAAKRQAGAVYAAMFLREFVGDVPWCHVDIAGTGMVSGAATGFGVGLILSLAESLASGPTGS